MHKNLKKILVISIVLSLCLVLVACQGSGLIALGAANAVPSATFTPFQANSPTARPTATLTPSPVPSPTTPPCTEQHGTIEQKEEMLVPAFGSFTFRVYLPPCFKQNQNTRYPVLYMIHGQTYQDDQWDRLGIGAAADELIVTKKAPPFLIVMPREDDTFSDIYKSGFIQNMVSGLIPWVDAHYPTCAERACRAIGGLSRGGAWALHLGFTHWELFGAVGLHSTPPFIGDPQLFRNWQSAIPKDQMPRIYMDIGRRDPFLTDASTFESILVGYAIPHEWYLFNGTHEEAYWSSHVSDYLEWYSRPWSELPQTLQVH